jgi:hypothetical protein
MTETEAMGLDVWATAVSLLCFATRRTRLVANSSDQDEAMGVLARDLVRDEDVHRRALRFTTASEPRLHRDSTLWQCIAGGLRLGRARMSSAEMFNVVSQ